MNHVVKILFFVALRFSAQAQLPAEEPVDYLYKKDWYVGLQLSTNGFGGSFSYERNRTYKFKQGIHVSIASLKSDKETRKTNSTYSDSRSYVFGKLNLLFAGRISYGASWLLFERKRVRGMAMRYNIHLGPLMGLTKPIYLKIKEPYTQIPEGEPIDTKYDPNIHHNENIYGRSSIWKGFSESKFTFGAYLKSGLQFDFSANSNKILAVEVGLQLDYFPRVVELFYLGKNKNIFPGMYASVQFGKNKI